MDDPISADSDGKKYDFLTEQMEALRKAFEKACPNDQLLICIRHTVPQEDGELKTVNLFSHTRINDNELARAIYDWAYLLHGSHEEEDEDNFSSSWAP